MFGFLEKLSGAEIIGLIAVLAGALSLCLLILTIGWASMHATRVRSALKRDMLARNLSAEEIDRLTQSDQFRLSSMEFEQRTRQQQIAADLKRDLVAKGVSIDEVMRLTGESAPQAPGESRTHGEAVALAGAISRMVQDGKLDENAVASLIEMFLHRSEVRPPTPAAPTPLEDRAPAILNDNVRPALG